MMKTILLTIAISIASTFAVIADSLPTLNVKDWNAYHLVSKGKNFAVGLDAKGNIEMYFMKRNERLNLKWPAYAKVIVEVKSKKSADAKWKRRYIKADGFISPTAAQTNPKKVTIEGTVTGGKTFKLHLEFLKEGIKIDGELGGDSKDAKKVEYRLSIETGIGEIYRVSGKDKVNNEKYLKGRMRGSELRISTRKNKKAERIRLFEKVKAEKLNKVEINELILKSKAIGRGKMHFSLIDPKLGKLKIKTRGSHERPFSGFSLTTLLIDKSGKKVSSGIKLEYK